MKKHGKKLSRLRIYTKSFYAINCSTVCPGKNWTDLPHNLANIKDTKFENYSEYRIWIVEFWQFRLIFVLLKVTCLVTLFDCKIHFLQKLAKLTWHFNQLFSTQNVNIARFARNMFYWDFFCFFQPLWIVKLLILVDSGGISIIAQ